MELKIIPFEYCSLERAAKFFGCEIDDFFHWYETKKISISFKLSDHKATLLSKNNNTIEFKSEFYGEDHIEYDYLQSAENEFSFIDSSSLYVANRVSYDHLCKVYRINGYASEFWRPCEAVITTLRNGGRIMDSFAASPYDCNDDFRIMITVTEINQHSDPDKPIINFIPNFSLTDLVLHKKDLDIVNHIMSGIPYHCGDENMSDTSENERHSVIENQPTIEWCEFSSKDTSLKFIAGMTLALAKSSPKYRNGSKMNKSAIAKDAIIQIQAQGMDFDITERQLTNLINQALNDFAPKLDD